jgi:hypothetical protein
MLAFPLFATPLYVLAAHLSAGAYLYRLWPNVMRWLGVHLHCKDALEDVLVEIVVPIRSKQINELLLGYTAWISVECSQGSCGGCLPCAKKPNHRGKLCACT